MEDDAYDRLRQVLTLLRYDPSQPRHHRHNLLCALREFAALQGDADIETACEALMHGVKRE